MSNLEMLQKLALGTKNTETVKITDDEGTDYDFTLRPLTDGELTSLQILEKKPYTMKIKVNRNGQPETVNREDDPESDMDVDMGDFTESQAKAMYTAIAWSLSIEGEKVPVQAIKDLGKGVPELLFNEVIRISKLTDKDLTAIKNFRKF